MTENKQERKEFIICFVIVNENADIISQNTVQEMRGKFVLFNCVSDVTARFYKQKDADMVSEANISISPSPASRSQVLV